MKKNRRHWANWFKPTCVLFGIKLLQATVQIDSTFIMICMGMHFAILIIGISLHCVAVAVKKINNK